MRRGLLITLAGLALGLPESASAKIHYGSEAFRPPVVAPSLEPATPSCNPQETREEQRSRPEGGSNCTLPVEGYRSIIVAYDDKAGTVSIRVSVFDPALWGAVLGQEEFDLGARCGSEALMGNFEGEEGAYDTAMVDREGENPNTVTLAGYEGSVEATVDWTGASHVFSWHSRALAHRNWRCLTLNRGGEIRLNGWPHAGHRA